MYRFKYNYKYLVQWRNLIQVNSQKLHLNIKKPLIILTFNLFNLKAKDYLILVDALYILEVITGQRGFLSKIIVNKKISKSISNFKVQVHLRDKNAFQWLEFFKEFVVAEVDRDESVNVVSKLTEQGNVSMVIKNLTFFPGLEEEYFQWNIPLKIDFVFNSKNKYESVACVDNLGLLFNNKRK